MVDRDQADKAADSLLEPSRKVLAEEKAKREAKDIAWKRQMQSPAFPAAAAAGTALLTLEYVGDPAYAFGTGLLAGWIVGLAMRARAR